MDFSIDLPTLQAAPRVQAGGRQAAGREGVPVLGLAPCAAAERTLGSAGVAGGGHGDWGSQGAG